VTTSGVRIGVQLQPQHADYAQIKQAVAEAEDLGADIAFNWDHFYPLYGEPEGKHFECWTMLGAWAEQTSRIEIGALVTCNSYRNPELLADMARTVDHISAGRLILGIGSGWFEKDYQAYGYEFGTAGSRLDELAESLPRIGGGGERKTLRMVARHADIWHSFSDLETFKRKSEVLARWCAEFDRDPSEIERSVGVQPGAPRESGPEFVEAGARLFTIGLGGPSYDLSPVRDWVAWRDSL